jgi:hypothetical protein
MLLEFYSHYPRTAAKETLIFGASFPASQNRNIWLMPMNDARARYTEGLWPKFGPTIEAFDARYGGAIEHRGR